MADAHPVFEPRCGQVWLDVPSFVTPEGGPRGVVTDGMLEEVKRFLSSGKEQP